MKKIGRRCFLRTSALTVFLAKAFSSMSVGFCATRGPSSVGAQRKNALLNIFGDPAAANLIGGNYIRNRPQEANTSWLELVLFGDTELKGVEEVRAHLASRREEEFRNDEVVVLEGWILARCEARACALIFLW